MTFPTHPVLVAGAWRPARSPAGSFRAINPKTGESIDEMYPVSGFPEIEEAIRAGRAAAAAMASLSPDAIASFLEAYAGGIEARTAELVRTAHLETGLAEESRLRTVELPRTVLQLLQ